MCAMQLHDAPVLLVAVYSCAYFNSAWGLPGACNHHGLHASYLNRWLTAALLCCLHYFAAVC
jgi:hypothetical protein